MLLDGHYLDCIVAVGHDAGQHLVLEFGVSAHAFALLRHADVTFVDKQRTGVGHEATHFPLERLLGSPHLSRENLGLLVLHHSCGIGRDAFTHSAFPVYEHLVELSVMQSFGLELYFPYTVADGFKCVFHIFLPFGEVADEGYAGCVRSPFAEHPSGGGAV